MDVWPLLAGEAGATNPHEAYVYYYEINQLQAVVSGDGRWKLQLPHTYRSLAAHGGGKNGVPTTYEKKVIKQPELYDLANDVSETTDLAARHPEIVRRLHAVAERARAELGDSLTKRRGRGNRPAGQLENIGGIFWRFSIKPTQGNCVICDHTEHFGRGYGFLADQLNRAALSISNNIAEGNGRFTKPFREAGGLSKVGRLRRANLWPLSML